MTDLSEKKRMPDGTFLPGNAEGGRKKIDPKIKAAFQELTMEAVQVLADLMRKGDPSNRLKAACEILDRAIGKVPAALDSELEERLAELEQRASRVAE